MKKCQGLGFYVLVTLFGGNRDLEGRRDLVAPLGRQRGEGGRGAGVGCGQYLCPSPPVWGVSKEGGLQKTRKLWKGAKFGEEEGLHPPFRKQKIKK